MYSLLVESGLISAEQLQETLNDANRPQNQHIGFFLRKKNLISDEDLGHLLARSFSLPFVHLRDFDIAIDAVQLIPVSFARKNTLIPIMQEENIWWWRLPTRPIIKSSKTYSLLLANALN
jgi:hypothetical protein